MGKACCGQNTKSGVNKLIFPTPTQTHIFHNRSNSYSHLSTAHVRSLAVAENKNSKRFGGIAMGSNNEDYIFYSFLLDLLIK
jgi:hypothetical protein